MRAFRVAFLLSPALVLSIAQAVCAAPGDPSLTIENAAIHGLLEPALKLAIATVDRNTRQGILAAGADYGGEWTRDCAINAWNGVSLLRPQVAETSLWSVTRNRLTIGHQYWDKIIWTIGAWNHYKVTGSREFLAPAYACARNTMRELESTEFDKEYELFMGPSHLCDGIAGYPEPPQDPRNRSSFVLDHPNTKPMKALSTNAIYCGAYQCLIEMAQELKRPPNEADEYRTKAARLREAVNSRFWLEKENRFGYLILKDGTLDRSQEGMGVAYALIFGLCDKDRAELLLANTRRMPQGITCVWPNFPRFSDERPGRHNNMVWPMLSGFWGYAAAMHGSGKVFQFELENNARLALDRDKGNGNFREIYHAISGVPDGGWQSGTHWNSCNHQTWSATAYLRLVLCGLVGLDFRPDGVCFQPHLPAGYGTVKLDNLKYRGMVLSIAVRGAGDRVKAFRLNGQARDRPSVPTSLKFCKVPIGLGKIGGLGSNWGSFQVAQWQPRRVQACQGSSSLREWCRMR
jgi:hypothetical protein